MDAPNGLYIDFLQEVVTWMRVAEGLVNVASALGPELGLGSNYMAGV